MLEVVALGGLGEFGMNMMLVACGETGYPEVIPISAGRCAGYICEASASRVKIAVTPPVSRGPNSLLVAPLHLQETISA